MRDLNTPFIPITGKITLSMGGWMKIYTVYPCHWGFYCEKNSLCTTDSIDKVI